MTYFGLFGAPGYFEQLAPASTTVVLQSWGAHAQKSQGSHREPVLGDRHTTRTKRVVQVVATRLVGEQCFISMSFRTTVYMLHMGFLNCFGDSHQAVE